MRKEKIAANVVTYNRKELLKGCLNALLKQSRKPDLIIVVDNNSTDGTREMLEKEFLSDPIFDYVRLEENTGSAGGQYTGIKRAYEKGFDWVWCMDDDTIPSINALKELIFAEKFLKEKGKFDVGFLASNVFWTNGQMCKLNKPALNRYSSNSYLFLEKGLVELWSSSFVSMFISKKAIKESGLPIKEYFIWGDDFEYSLRISHKFKCFLVGKSKVIHKTKANNALNYRNITKEQLWKYKCSMRNLTYTTRKIENKKIKYVLLVFLLTRFWQTLSPKKINLIWQIFLSFAEGLFFNPKVVRNFK